MPKKIVGKPRRIVNDDSESKLFAFLGILLTVIGYIIVMIARKDDRYAVYYAKQGLILFLASIVAWVAIAILGWIPVVGWIINWVLWAIILALWVIGIIYSLSGEEKDIPLIGKFAEKI